MTSCPCGEQTLRATAGSAHVVVRLGDMRVGVVDFVGLTEIGFRDEAKAAVASPSAILPAGGGDLFAVESS